MNIFYIEETPAEIAKSLVDKHIVKMPLESAQMLSTAHRLLDGRTVQAGGGGKKRALFLLDGETWGYNQETGKFIIHNEVCYKVAHAKHPSTVWTMAGKENYLWHAELFREMLLEYTRRYDKRHKCEDLLEFLSQAPANIPLATFTPPTPAMPAAYKSEDILDSYRKYYASDKWRFAKWKHGAIPWWLSIYMRREWVKNPDNQQKFQVLSEKKSLPMDVRIFQTGREILNASLS
jgi:hypothetical protein